MNKFIYILISIVLVSCSAHKELVNSEKIISQDSTLVIKDEVIQELDTLKIEEEKKDVVSEMKVIDRVENNDLNERQQIKLIEQHEKKTNLKVIDMSKKSTAKSTTDTTSGWIAYSVPENMKVSKTYSVKIRISKRTSGQNKAVLILGNDDAINNPEFESIATIEDVRVSGEMSAELRGDNESFKIVELSTPTQNIDNESYTEWEWLVTPLKSGENPLKLVIKLRDLNKDIVVFNRSIKVKSNVKSVVGGFFDKYWTWLISTFVIPLFLYYRNRKKKRRQTKKS